MSKLLGEKIDLVEGLKKEADRRIVILNAYRDRPGLTAEEVVGVVRMFGELKESIRALESRDPVTMLRTYKRLVEMEVK